MQQVKINLGGEDKDFTLGVSVLLYGSVGTGKTTFSMTLAGELLKAGMPVIWVCLDESPIKIREKMNYFDLDWQTHQSANILRFIDIYSDQITGQKINDKYIINVSSVFNMNEINRAMMRALSEVKGKGIVIFDSVSTLLLYNKSGPCDEFLKVHMSRINSAGFSGFFIMQQDLHDPQIEETLKMMCDSWLGFGFSKEGRKISIYKLPLGSTGEWIESSLFKWQTPPQLARQQPRGVIKLMDSGGFIEHQVSADDAGDLFADELGQGKPSQSKAPSRVSSKSKNPSRSGDAQTTDDGSYQQSQQGHGGFGQGSQIYGGQLASINMAAPDKIEVNVQNVESMYAGEQKRISSKLSTLDSERESLQEALSDHRQLSQLSQERLEKIISQESRTYHEIQAMEEKTKAIGKVISTKREAITEWESDYQNQKDKYLELVKRQQITKMKADGILDRKKSLESKLLDLTDEQMDYHIDLVPYLKGVIGKLDEEVGFTKNEYEKLEKKIDAATKEVDKLEMDMLETYNVKKVKETELETVKEDKTKAESEISLITGAQEETQMKLKSVLDTKRRLEEEMAALMDDSK